MKITVFGATGRTGVPLVQQALDAGYEVVAFARTPSKLNISHENLSVVQGDIKDPAAVEQAIVGADAVLSVIGHTKNSAKDVQTVGTRNIVSAMEKHGVKRLISLTGAGVKDPNDQPGLFDRFIVVMLKLISGDVLKDAQNHAQVIKQSGLDWTIVRGPMLTEGPHTGDYRVGYVGVNTSPRISRADVADFMLTQVEDRKYIGKAPMVSD